MKAERIHAYGGPEEFRYEDAPTPEPGPGEILIETAATSVNPVDWKMRSGEAKSKFPVDFPGILGRDVSGKVVKVGLGVSNPSVGQLVMGLVKGSYAEYVLAKASEVTVVPDGLDLKEAAALPLVVTTGAQLIQHIGPKQGDLLLVTGAMGSVGRSAVFMAKKLGARVIAGVKAEQKEKAGSLGADQVVSIDDDSEIAGLPQLDAIADTVDHEVIGKLIPKLKAGGVLGSVLGKPEEAEGKDIRVEAFTAHPDAALLREMADAVRDGKLVIPIARRLKLGEADEAHRLGESGSLGGKILLIP